MTWTGTPVNLSTPFAAGQWNTLGQSYSFSITDSSPGFSGLTDSIDISIRKIGDASSVVTRTVNFSAFNDNGL